MMNADKAHELSEKNSPTYKALNFAEKNIREAIEKGVFSTRCSCPSFYEPDVFWKLRENGFNVSAILREANDTIYEIKW